MKKLIVFFLLFSSAIIGNAQGKISSYEEIEIDSRRAENLIVLYRNNSSQHEQAALASLTNKDVHYYEVKFTLKDFSGKMVMAINLKTNSVVYIGTFSKEVATVLTDKPACIQPVYSICMTGCNNECHSGVGCLIACTGQCFLNYCTTS